MTDVANVAYQVVGEFGVFGSDEAEIYIRVVGQLKVDGIHCSHALANSKRTM